MNLSESKTNNLGLFKTIGLLCTIALLVTILIIGIDIAKQKVNSFNCMDIYVWKMIHPNNIFNFVLNDRISELGCGN